MFTTIRRPTPSHALPECRGWGVWRSHLLDSFRCFSTPIRLVVPPLGYFLLYFSRLGDEFTASCISLIAVARSSLASRRSVSDVDLPMNNSFARQSPGPQSGETSVLPAAALGSRTQRSQISRWGGVSSSLNSQSEESGTWPIGAGTKRVT